MKPAKKKVETKGKATAKTAQRAKVLEQVIPCPDCGSRVVPVQFYREKGHPVDARGCAKCRKVWQRVFGGAWLLLAEEVPGL